MPPLPRRSRRRNGPSRSGTGAGAEVAADAGVRLVSNLKLFSHLANIGDTRSLVIHPASTTHQQLSDAEQRASGVTPGLVRLAVGLEGIDDILADLARGLTAAAAAEGHR